MKLFRDMMKLLGPALLLTLAGFWLAYQFVDPAPPSSITIATGQPTGAYYLFAQHYQELLARDRITLNIRKTSGSKDNLALLNDPQAGIEIAFVQSGVAEMDAEATSSSSLTGLASLYFEPLWLFHRLDTDLERLTALQGNGSPLAATAAAPKPWPCSYSRPMTSPRPIPTSFPWAVKLLWMPCSAVSVMACSSLPRLDPLWCVPCLPPRGCS